MNALPVVSGANCVPAGFTTDNATESLPAIECAGFTSPSSLDVWFSFVATSTDQTVGVVGFNAADAMVELSSGDCSNLVSLGCADATFPQAAVETTTEQLIQTGLTVGAKYYVGVYDYAHGSVAHLFEICVTEGQGSNIGIDENTGAEAWSIFPNPSEGLFNLNYTGANTAGNIEVIDVTGRVVYAERTQLAIGTTRSIDLKGLSAGTYTGPGGRIVQVDAGPDHLRELREIIYPRLKEDTKPAFMAPAGFELLDVETLRYPAALEGAGLIGDLLVMTPHLYRATADGRARAAALTRLDITVDVRITRLVRTSASAAGA